MQSITILVAILAIILSVILGIKLKMNIGLLAFLFSLIIGLFSPGLSTTEIYGFWPVKMCVQLVIITYFFGFATNTGTISYISEHMIYRMRNIPFLIPLAYIVLVFSITALGLSPLSVSMFTVPIFYSYCKKTNTSPLYVAVFTFLGGIPGMMAPTGLGGIVIKGIIDNMNLDGAMYMRIIWLNSIKITLLLIIIYYIILKLYKISAPLESFNKPEAPTKKQKINLVILIGIVLYLFCPLLIQNLFPNRVTSLLLSMDPSLIYLIGIVICLYFKLGDESEILVNKVPWGVILLIGGMVTLISIINHAGFAEVMKHLLESNSSHLLSSKLMAIIFTISAGLLTLVTDGLAVAIPMLFSIAISVSASTGLNLSLAFTVIAITSFIAGISPVSTGGSIALSYVDPEIKNKMACQMILCAIFNVLVLCMFIILGVLK